MKSATILSLTALIASVSSDLIIPRSSYGVSSGYVDPGTAVVGGYDAPNVTNTGDKNDSKGSKSKGKDSKGSSSKGKDYKGSDSKGKDSKGSDSKGKDYKGSNSKGKDSKGSNSKGKDSKGSDSKGKDSKGSNSKGKESKGSNSKTGYAPRPTSQPPPNVYGTPTPTSMTSNVYTTVKESKSSSIESPSATPTVVYTTPVSVSSNVASETKTPPTTTDGVYLSGASPAVMSSLLGMMLLVFFN